MTLDWTCNFIGVDCATNTYGSTATCDGCAAGSFFVSDKCIPCEANCKTCSGYGPGECTVCADGYYLDNAGTCVACGDADCAICSGLGSGKCTSCASGYYLDAGKCLACEPGCATCNGAGSGQCTSCVAGYARNGMSCGYCGDGCASCASPGFCLKCADGNQANAGVCPTACPEGQVSRDGSCTGKNFYIGKN